MSVNSFFNSPYYALYEFAFFCAVGFTAGSLGMI